MTDVIETAPIKFEGKTVNRSWLKSAGLPTEYSATVTPDLLEMAIKAHIEKTGDTVEFRKPKNLVARVDRLVANNFSEGKLVVEAPKLEETEEQVKERIDSRFEIMGQMTDASISGAVRALVISGPAGIGKSFDVEERLTAAKAAGALTVEMICGGVSTVGLIRSLWKVRNGGVLMIDDSDMVFGDEDTLNILKHACDTKKRRVISWTKNSSLVDDETGERIDKNFVFNGAVIFITNLDFEVLIARGNRNAIHMQALMSRAHYIDLSMKSMRDVLVRIKSVAKHIFADRGVEDAEAQATIMAWMETKAKARQLQELSLRTITKVADLYMATQDWERIANVTLCKQV